MASVQLSASSLTPPRARLPQQTRRKACRSLFGPVDHEELNRDLDAKLSEISARDQERWNFNFASGAPLHGDYEWERAAVGATTAFYQESGRAREKAAAAQPPTEAPAAQPPTEAPAAQPPTEAPGGVSCAAGGAASPVRTRTGKPSCTKRKTSARLTTTTLITDFYIKRKKQGDLKQRESAPPNPLRFLSAEQTPRKGLR